MTKYHSATRALFVLLIPATAGLAGAMTLTHEQQTRLLTEAQSALDAGAKLEATRPVAARKAYEQAAGKFQLLTENGSCDGDLYRRLADACLHSGQIGKTIANYQRAEQLLGPTPRIRAGLSAARRLRDRDEPVLAPSPTFAEKLSLWNRSWSVPWRFRIALVAWTGLWTAMGVSLFIRPGAWRISAGVCGLVFVLLAASLAWDFLPDWNHTRGVVTVPAATLRQGNGETFPPHAAPLKDGAEFNVIERRGRWVRVSLPDGNTGWLDVGQVELLPPRHTLWS